MSLEWISVRSMTYFVTDLSIITKGNNNRMLLSWNYSKEGAGVYSMVLQAMPCKELPRIYYAKTDLTISTCCWLV